MDSSGKILELGQLGQQISPIRTKGARVVLCQGHFNIVHPGHLRFLQRAKELGECLVVAVQGTDHLQEEYRSQYFSEQERLESVAALHLVDFVILLQVEFTIEWAIGEIGPDYYVVGKEFQHERAAEMQGQLQALEKVGGQVVYHADKAQSEGRIPHSSKEKIDRDRILQFYQACAKQSIDINALKDHLLRFSECRLLVIGDTIVDSYISCEAVGMSSEAPLIVAKELETEKYLGGAGIVAAHVKALGASCDYLSVVGADDAADFATEKLGEYGVNARLITDDSRPTTFKTRFLVGNQKVFRLSKLKDHALLPKIENRLIGELEAIAADYDGIIVSDFNYGVLTERVTNTLAELAQTHSLVLAADMQCSSQVGDIRKYHGYDLLCPNEKEARISLHSQEAGLEWIANELLETAAANNLILKLAGSGFIAYSRTGTPYRSQHFPALVSNPLDVVGAGDSLLAAVATSLCGKLDIMEAAALSVCVASLAVQVMGNVPVQAKTVKALLDSLS